MVINKVDESKRSKFYMSLQKYSNIANRRGVSAIINTHSDHVGVIDLYVTGKKGTAVKNLVIVYDTVNDEWIVYNDGYEYRMDLLSDVSSILKNMVQKLSSILTKI